MSSTSHHGHQTGYNDGSYPAGWYYGNGNSEWHGWNTTPEWHHSYQPNATPLYQHDRWRQWQHEKKKKQNNRGTISHRRCKGGDNYDSTLKVFYATVTLLGKDATAYLLNRPDHVLLTVETHLRDQPAHAVMNEMILAGWAPIMAPAVQADDTPTGNKGGAMISHKQWLQTATPATAEGPQGRELPGDDLAWKHFRIKGLHIIIGTIYFDHTLGFTGRNLHKFNKTIHRTDNGKRMLILPGDYNMEPDEWGHQLLQSAGLQILTVGDEKTCNTSTGSKQNDYIIVSIDLVPFIINLKLEADVPWGPHLGLSFEIDRRPEKTLYQALARPAGVPYAKDDKGKPTPWSINETGWETKLLNTRNRAEKAIDATNNDDSGTCQHTASSGPTDLVRNFSVRYAQWSMAAEESALEAALEAKPEAPQSDKQKGRGLLPTYDWVSLANKSSDLTVEHHIWSQPQPIARAGSDLYSTLWAAISGAMRSIASAKRLDDSDSLTEGKHTMLTQRLYSGFFNYLIDEPKSPPQGVSQNVRAQHRQMAPHIVSTFPRKQQRPRTVGGGGCENGKIS